MNTTCNTKICGRGCGWYEPTRPNPVDPCSQSTTGYGWCNKYYRYVCNEGSCVDINTTTKHQYKSVHDQKAKADDGKAKLTLVPRAIIWAIAAIREYGNNKYPEGGPDNWKKVDAQRYRDALYRHLMYYLDDPNGVDEESGLPHLWHLACNVAFLCELEPQPYREREGE